MSLRYGELSFSVGRKNEREASLDLYSSRFVAFRVDFTFPLDSRCHRLLVVCSNFHAQPKLAVFHCQRSLDVPIFEFEVLAS